MGGLPLFGLLIGQNVMKKNRRPQSNIMKAANNDGFEVRGAGKAIPDAEQSSEISGDTDVDQSTDLRSCDNGEESGGQSNLADADYEVDSCDAGNDEDADDTDDERI